MTKRHSFEFIKNQFEKFSYNLLETEYINAHKKLHYRCDKGHEHTITWNHWRNGHRCPFCDGQSKPSISFIRTEMEKEGYVLLTKKYINSRQKLFYICPEGHRWNITWGNWKHNGARCMYCSAKTRAIEYHRLTFEYVKKEFEKYNFKLLSNSYENCEQKIKCVCPKGHQYSTTWHQWNSVKRCPKCFDGSSEWEKLVRYFVLSLDVEVVANDKTMLINPFTYKSLELDIWMPEINKAIECNGVYWHSFEKHKKIDKLKKRLCEDLDICLLVILDDEWLSDINKCKQNIIKFVNYRRENNGLSNIGKHS